MVKHCGEHRGIGLESGRRIVAETCGRFCQARNSEAQIVGYPVSVRCIHSNILGPGTLNTSIPQVSAIKAQVSPTVGLRD